MPNRRIAIALALLSACAGFALSYVLAATPAPAANTFDYLPVVANQAVTPTPVRSTLTTLVDTDAGFVTCATIPNTMRVILAYTDRHNGNRLFVGEDIGNSVKPIADPILTRLVMGTVDQTNPNFAFPGPKQGFGMICYAGNEMRVYATSRDEGDITGPFKVKRLTMAIPAP